MTTRSSQMKRTPLLTVIAQRCNCTNNLLFNFFYHTSTLSLPYLQNENKIIIAKLIIRGESVIMLFLVK